MSLREWQANRWLIEHVTSRGEVADLLSLVERDLSDAALRGLSPDWRLGIAYNAVLQLATTALAAAGYRPGRERGHERAILSLRHTVGLDRESVDFLDAVRRKRNVSHYERSASASSAEADEVCEFATRLNRRVRAWLRREYPELVDPGRSHTTHE